MSDPSQPSATLPIHVQQLIAGACDRFDREWRSGNRPRIEDYLTADLAIGEKLELLRALLDVEILHRSRAREVFNLEEYLSHFEQQADLVREVFSAQTATQIPGGQSAESESSLDAVLHATVSHVPAFSDLAVNSDDPPAGPIAAGRPAFLGRYRITDVLGSGTFGIVYKAHDNDLSRDVAIKLPRHRIVELLGGIDAYLKEARVVASLKHPHIVPVHDIGYTADGLCYVVYEFIDGSDLKTRLQNGRDYGPIEAAALVSILADALGYAHAHKNRIKHRDFMPANILIDRNDKPYLTDFGLAHLNEDYGSGPDFAGTLAYMSPEQREEKATEWTDVQISIASVSSFMNC